MGTVADKLAAVLDSTTAIRGAISRKGGAISPSTPRRFYAAAIDNLSVMQDYYYGIEWNTTVANPVLTRVGRTELHRTLPIQAGMRRCLLSDDGKVTAYLDATDSTRLADGTAAPLDGSAGQVMVEIPAHYRRFEHEGSRTRCLLSTYALPGFHYVPLAYRSAYEAALDRSIAATPRLCSVVNTTVNLRGGSNKAEWDGTYRSLLGLPTSGISLTRSRTYAQARGNGWNCDLYSLAKSCFWLYMVEYANLNCQDAYNPQLTADGFRQGGLGLGVATFSDWNGYNAFNPIVPCGTTNRIGNATGTVTYTCTLADGSAGQSFSVPSYRGIENIFGHLWKWFDGAKCLARRTDSGDTTTLYTCLNPALFQDTSADGYTASGDVPTTSGYIRTLLCGDSGDIFPIEVGGSSSTYFCDYLHSIPPGSGEEWRGVRHGGIADMGISAGLCCFNINLPVSSAYITHGARLCYVPEGIV